MKKVNLVIKDKVALSLILTGTGVATLTQPQAVLAQTTAPPEVKNGIDKAIATVEALNPLSQAALSVALLPFAAFLTMAFIQKVMSRV